MIRGIIFDMDGTITKPYIDWKALREEIGAPQGRTIIEYIEGLDAEKGRWAQGILESREEEAALNSEINCGVDELLEYLKNRGIKTALVTNNNRRSLELVLKKHDLHFFDVTLSREDGQVKPSGDLILKALERMGLDRDEVIAVGDGRFDIEASAKAGVRCVYLCNSSPALEHEPMVYSLSEVIDLIETKC